jgi:hypothetical protein
MHKLEERIRTWRQEWAAKLSREQLDELEGHLREELDGALAPALDLAWTGAVAKLGDPALLAAEFAKVSPRSGWLPARIVGFLTVGLTLLIAALLPFLTRQGDALLGIHVMLVTLGYVTTYLIGMLGVCFALMRPFADWHAGRARSLRRVAVPLTMFAGVCTLLGVVLGMRWAAREWGVAWSWDPRETGGLAVVVGNGALAVFLMLQRVPDSARMALALVNSLLVTLAWFHPVLGWGWGEMPHSYGAPSWAAAVLLAALVGQAVLLFVALTPEGSLRRSHVGRV